MRSALVLLAVVVCPLLLECSPTCQPGNRTGVGGGLCPIELSPAGPCVTVRVWITADDLRQAPTVDIVSRNGGFTEQKTFRPVGNKIRGKRRTQRVRCASPDSGGVALWELVYDCVPAAADGVVSVSYSSASANCTAPDPKPDFDVSVNRSSKSITVTVKPGRHVFVRLCYVRSPSVCNQLPRQDRVTMDPSESPSVRLDFPHLLPCLCVEVYYTHQDAPRNRTCPFQEERVADAADVLLASHVQPRGSTLRWDSPCRVRDLPHAVSASLCWKRSHGACTPVLNSSLRGDEDGDVLVYGTRAVDRHPHMCVQFSLQGEKNVSCPFTRGESSWEASVGRGRRTLILHVASRGPATFSAQLCLLGAAGCAPVGPVHVLAAGDAEVNVPAAVAAQEPCVQVWRSRPALDGRRILCPDYTHHRWGTCAAAALTLLVVVALLGTLVQRLARSGAAGWLFIHKPVLLVSSSERPAHVSASCALGSILQGELRANVHMALWAQSSQRQAGVADLGPIPWLYGQWEAVREAQGKVLLIWSPEAKTIYERETRSRGAAQLTEADEDTDREASTVTGPVFAAALTRLQAALQRPAAPGVAVVYFEGLGHSRDIPKALGGVPRYCLPQEFRGLLQELEGPGSASTWPCGARLLSKVLSVRLARKLAARLRTQLPGARSTRPPGLELPPDVAEERGPLRGPETRGSGFTRPMATRHPCGNRSSCGLDT